MLAIKYRPTSFSDVIGQDHIINILQDEINTNNIKGSYLFIGPSGCAKTTTARILANELNSYVVELDMASNGTAEDMRQIVDNLHMPIGFNKVVIILDEVQAAMSRKDSVAAQVLLKTLEEPPSYVVFILCTTEGDKVIDTIKSRCETFIFNRISPEDIVSRLKYICDKEQIEYKESDLQKVAKYSKGNLRQAITYIDQYKNNLSAIHIDNNKLDTYLNLFYAVADKNLSEVVNIIPNNESFLQGFFTFMLDLGIYIKTGKNENIPSIYYEDINKFTIKDRALIDTLINDLLPLQHEAKNSPIIKQLLIATLYVRML